MRRAHDFVEEYRRKGYPDERIRIIASMRPEPLRSEVLKVLDAAVAETPTQEKPPVAPAAAVPVVETPAEQPAPAPEPVAATKSEGGPDVPTEPPKEEPQAATEAPSPRAKIEAAQAKVEAAQAKQAEALRKEIEKIETAHKKKIEAMEREREKTEAALREQADALAKKQEALAAAVKEKDEEIARLKLEAGRAEELARKVADVEPLREELNSVRAEQEKLATLRSGLEAKIAELETFIARRDTLLAEKDEALAKAEAALAEERAELKTEVARNAALASQVEAQAERLRHVDAVNGKIAEFSDALERIQAEAEQLRESEQEKSGRIVSLEGDLARSREEATELQRQLASNEQAVDDLRQKLTTRESELESIRMHFDSEAKDLKRRADQEMRMIERRIRRVRQLAAVGVGIAACVTVLMAIALVGEHSAKSELREQIAQMKAPNTPPSVAAGESVAPSAGTVAASPAPAPGPGASGVPTPVRPMPAVLPMNNAPPAIGPTEMPRVDAPAPTAAARTKTIKYTVKKGDTLSSIAAEHLGSEAKWRAIARENNIPLDRAHAIRPGQALTITVEE